MALLHEGYLCLIICLKSSILKLINVLISRDRLALSMVLLLSCGGLTYSLTVGGLNATLYMWMLSTNTGLLHVRHNAMTL